METVSENTCFNGTQGVYTHSSGVCGCDMTFGLFLPEEATRWACACVVVSFGPHMHP